MYDQDRRNRKYFCQNLSKWLLWGREWMCCTTPSLSKDNFWNGSIKNGNKTIYRILAMRAKIKGVTMFRIEYFCQNLSKWLLWGTEWMCCTTPQRTTHSKECEWLNWIFTSKTLPIMMISNYRGLYPFETNQLSLLLKGRKTLSTAIANH